ncbi:uroporphyrinogen-III C-methyltransferase [Salmonirosea aquatica]|uniref:uroporphyrinogen-III C-methyltransferase n=1 Tax=Salmonirosea aquatica TaxID=2654236 RepID=A0A7C9BK36_9BACT|nr:uroporphyrinogen-III C-methyltransferase [Cytophagaceae bacterium SJW1-29]
MTPKLTLVGAGPGDEELITLKGIRALEKADVVLYDDLANAKLLEYCPSPTLKIYVGKRAGRTSFQQGEINSLILRLARKRGHVVRLKGGDPFVFGRGHEEAEFVRRHGIPCEVVPGVSSCVAVPASQGIPVTRRGISESFWVITGTTRAGELSSDLHLAAQSNATVVVLMGLKKISEICSLYTILGRGHLPMAVIQNGTRTTEGCVVGQTWEMPKLMDDNQRRNLEVGASDSAAGLNGPAVIVIGEVVALHPAYVLEYLQSLPMVA